MPHQSTVTATVLAQCKHFECIVPKHCSGYWRLLCQYNNIYAGSYKYLKEKKKYKRKTEEKKKNSIATVTIVLLEQTKSTVVFIHSPNKCHNIFTKYLFLVMVGYSFIFYYFILTYKKLTPQ